jgi:tetratricopeptide (TPR) repeat protein
VRFARRVVWTILLVTGTAPAAGAQFTRLPADLSALEEFARTDSSEAVAHYLVGLAYWGAGRMDQADRSLRHAVAIDPRYADAYLALAFLPFARRPQLRREEARGRVPGEWRGPLAEARGFLRRAYLINPLVDLRPLATLAGDGVHFVDHLSAGRYQAAFDEIQDFVRRHYDEARQPDRLPDEVLWYRGIAAAHLDMYGLAIHDVEVLLARSLKLDTTVTSPVPLRSNELRYLSAVLHHRAGRLERATELYREAAATDFGLYMAHVQLAGIHVDAGRFDDAIAERELAVAANPDDSSVHVDLALTQLQAGRIAHAGAPLERAAALNPRDARVPYLRGVVAEQGGDAVAARRHFERFIAIAPSRLESQVADARQRLERLP